MENESYNNDRLHTIWHDMKYRCNNPNCHAYKNYGGRGITVCKEWEDSYDAFVDWALSNGYNDSLTIDRIDNNKEYSPDNCKWSTYKEQGNNTRSCHRISYNGETHTIAEWGTIMGISPTTIRTRLCCGWNEIDAITTKRIHEPHKTRYYTYNGKTQTVSQWAQEMNIKYSALSSRLQNGWSIERALNEPVKQRSNSTELL